MSELYSAVEILTIANEIIGKNGPIEIDSGIYSHNNDMDENEKGSDIYILGKDGSVITFEQLIKLLGQLDELVNDLMDNTGRSYYFEGLEQTPDDKLVMSWGS